MTIRPEDGPKRASRGACFILRRVFHARGRRVSDSRAIRVRFFPWVDQGRRGCREVERADIDREVGLRVARVPSGGGGRRLSSRRAVTMLIRLNASLHLLVALPTAGGRAQDAGSVAGDRARSVGSVTPDGPSVVRRDRKSRSLGVGESSVRFCGRLSSDSHTSKAGVCSARYA
jgi:hypothetical protein